MNTKKSGVLHMWKDKYMDLCFNGQKLEDISKGMEIKYSHIPPKLFRYRPCTEFSLDEIKEQYVRIVSPSEFNDILDTHANIDFTVDFYGNNQSLKDLYRQNLQKYFTPEGLDKILGLNNWFEEVIRISAEKATENENIDIIASQKALKYVVDSEIINLNEAAGGLGRHIIRCCCFTERNDNLAMWYHYANKYSGICIEYEMLKFDEFDLRSRFMYPVIYSDKLPEISQQIHNFEPKYVNLFTWVTLHKKQEWIYEKEWRLVFSGDFMEDTNISFPAISAIYLGKDIEQQNREKIIKITHNFAINIYEMQVVNNSVIFKKVN